MKTKEPSLFEINRRGLKALARALGPVGYIRFLQLHQVGKGDYTKERYELLKHWTMEDVAAALRPKRKKKPGNKE
ncbi:MAG: hypothetical protein ABSE73_14955 [Planctomycetota bacterium]